MATMLFRLGSYAARRSWAVIIAWMVLLGLAVGAFAAFGGALKSSFDIPGTASGAVVDELAQKLPDTAGGTGTIVYQTDDGQAFTEAQQEAISNLVSSAVRLDGVAAVVDPFEVTQERVERAAQLDARMTQIDNGSADLERAVRDAEDAGTLLRLAEGIAVVSEDESTAIITVSYTQSRLDLSNEVKEATLAHFQDAPVSGTSVDFSAEISQGSPELFGTAEMIGLGIAAVVLIVILGSLLAAALPLITALVGVAIGVATSLSFSGIVDMASVTPVLGVMLGLAVGIDYTLFIVTRHRRQLLAGMSVPDSIGLATGTSGTAVVFAGATVIIALLALNVTGIPFLGLMGTVGAICVAFAVLIAVTLAPALLSLIGERLLRRNTRTSIGQKPQREREREQKPMQTVRAIVISIVTVGALLVIATPAMSMRVGLPDSSSDPQDSTSYRAFEAVETQFGAGANGPLLIAADIPNGLDDDERLAAQVDIAETLAALPNVNAVAPIAAADDNTLLAFQVKPEEGPNSISTEQLVESIRALPVINGDITLGVAGQAAINIDISEAIASALPLYLVVVIGLSLLIMIVVFRSLLVPVIATAGFILSLFATFGLIVALFQFGWGAELIGVHSTGPILSFLPVLLVGILFGLAMDYQLFLTSGMREAYVHGTPARAAVTKGLHAGRPVVIAAALIMASVFGGFIFSEATIVRSIGFGLAFGVLIDAFIVRLLLMPALMHLLGTSAWWLPRWLDRILPNVDIEGASLHRTQQKLEHTTNAPITHTDEHADPGMQSSR